MKHNRIPRSEQLPIGERAKNVARTVGAYLLQGLCTPHPLAPVLAWPVERVVTERELLAREFGQLEARLADPLKLQAFIQDAAAPGDVAPLEK